jgi:hypothetical protein
MPINLSNEQFQSLLDRYIREAVAEMQRRVRSANLVLTGEMIDSFRISAQERGRDYITQTISFSGVVRLKDLKSMNCTRMPPQEAMEYFVEREGVHTFPLCLDISRGTGHHPKPSPSNASPGGSAQRSKNIQTAPFDTLCNFSDCEWGNPGYKSLVESLWTLTSRL